MWPYSERDTIAQIASAPGNGIGVIRVSGPEAHLLGRALVKLKDALVPRHLYLATARDSAGEPIDRGLYVEFAAPASFTGEAVVEFQAHGSAVGLRAVLARVVELGARPAEPGEFSWRAFRNGKADLVELEAAAAAISAEGEAAYRLAQRQARGELSRRVEQIRAPLLDAATSLTAEVEFPDDGLATLDRAAVCGRLSDARAAVRNLLAGQSSAARVAEGAVVALVGSPNVGKSSLLNALLGFERAIVSPVAGTTRDTLSETVVIQGVVCRLIDTAGFRETANDIEEQGVRRGEEAARTADLVLWIQSADQPLVSLDGLGVDTGRVLRVATKADAGLPEAEAFSEWATAGAVRVSARSGQGMESLRQQMADRLLPQGEPGLVSGHRHARLLEESVTALERGERALEAGLPVELVLVDVNMAVLRLSQVLGENVSEDVLHAVFSSFCIGK